MLKSMKINRKMCRNHKIFQRMYMKYVYKNIMWVCVIQIHCNKSLGKDKLNIEVLEHTRSCHVHGWFDGTMISVSVLGEDKRHTHTQHTYT